MQNKYTIPFALLIAVVLFILFYAFTQDEIRLDNAHPYDADSYYNMAQQCASQKQISAIRPFVYRFALPCLVGKLFPTKIVLGFKIINLIFGTLSLFLLFLLLRIYKVTLTTSMIMLLLFITNPQAPFRFVWFFPVFTDATAFFFILLLFVIYKKNEKYKYITMVLLSLISFCGVFFREIVLIIPFVFLLSAVVSGVFVHFRKSLFYVVPFLIGVLGIYISHRIVDSTGEYEFMQNILFMISWHLKNKTVFLLSLFSAFGPIILLLLFHTYSNKSKRLFINNSEIPLYILLIVSLSFVSGLHTDRFIYWLFPVFFVVLGVVIDAGAINFKSGYLKAAFFIPLIFAQIFTLRIFNQIPNADFNVIMNPGNPQHLLFAPYGDNLNFAQTHASFMHYQSRRILLFQFLLLFIYLGCIWIIHKRVSVISPSE